MNRLALAACFLALLYVAIGGSVGVKPVSLRAAALPAIDPNEPVISGNGFAQNAVFAGATAAPSVTGLQFYGSAPQNDASTGMVRTCWYRKLPAFYLFLAGYPSQPGESILIEVESLDQQIRQLRLKLDENPENWRLEKVSLRGFPDANRFRIVASDASRKPMGWVGFSQPFTIRGQDTPELLKQLALVFLCATASLVAFVGPGLLIRARLRRPISAVWLPVPGIILMSLLGLIAWKGPATLSPQIISRTGLLLLVLFVGFELSRKPLSALTNETERRVLILVIALITLGVAKSVYSIGPSGELWRGRISRTFEANGRGDDRIPFHVVQLVGLRQRAYGPLGTYLFGPWTFSDRGPLTGFATSPIVLTTRARLPASMPDDRWTVFDPQGFAAFRIAAIVLAAVSLVIAFGLARLFLDDHWALLAFFVVAAAPFTVHEIYFTWPKIPAACFVLLAAYLVKTRRFFAAGSAVGIGYLFHPSALLWFPAIALSILLFDPMKTVRPSARFFKWAKRALLVGGGLALWIFVWQRANHAYFHQTGFFGYFLQAGLMTRTPANWIRARCISIVNTLVPLYAFLFHRTDADLLPPDLFPQASVQLAAQYWCTLPFACGLAFYFAVIRLAVAAWRSAAVWLALIFIPSFLFFVAYFGAPNTGLMREGLHAWFFGLLLFLVIVWRGRLAASRTFWTFAAFAIGIRGIEILFMLVPIASWSRGYAVQPPFMLSDALSLLTMTVICLGLSFYAVSYCSWMGAATRSNLPGESVDVCLTSSPPLLS